MIQYHPDDNMLIEYANGSLDWGLSILISAHLEHCSYCRAAVKTHEHIGASLFGATLSANIAPEMLNNLMEKIHAHIEHSPVTDVTTVYPSANDPSEYPKVLTKLFTRHPPQKWYRVFRHLTISRLITGQQKYEICLHKICCGGYVEEHDHGGVEITLVLRGSFSDFEGIYQVGDFISRNPGQIHRPTASEHGDCLCLSAIDAPIKLTNFTGRFINPFLTLKPQ